jgi:hypothetical protein
VFSLDRGNDGCSTVIVAVQYSLDIIYRVLRSVPFWTYVGLVPRYKVYIGRYIVCTKPYVRIRTNVCTTQCRARKKIIPRVVHTYVPEY